MHLLDPCDLYYLDARRMFRIARVQGSLVGRPVSKLIAFSGARVPSPISNTRVLSSSGDGVTPPPSLSEEDLLPRYVPRVGESEPIKRARLLYQSRKRGMLENGLLLSTFASRYLDKLDPNQLDQYDELINRPSNDWQLYYWITGREETPTRFDNEVMDMLKEHSRNEKREVRLRQPDLTPSDMFATAIPKPSI